MMLFAVVFGLSMDYEVFMLSRIREEYLRTSNATTSVADGLASTARVITAAAAIMVVLFASFMLEENREIKLFGLGLALAVLLDATLVRMVVVPATMELLGDRNWWLPKWLDRILPHVEIERTEQPLHQTRPGRLRHPDRRRSHPTGKPDWEHLQPPTSDEPQPIIPAQSVQSHFPGRQREGLWR